jgi:sugar lactone lactonase YvrE
MTRGVPAALLATAALLSTAAPAPAHPGTGIVVDARGRVTFTDLKQIWRWEPGGRVTAVVQGKHSHALRLEPDGAVTGEHLTYELAHGRWWTSVWRLAPDGSVGEVVPPAEGFPFVFSAAVAADGSAYFSRVDNNRRDVSEIWRRAADGRIELLAGGIYGYADGAGRAARFGPIGALTVGPDGDVYATDAPAIRRIAPDGRVTTLARGGRLLKQTPLNRLMGGRSGHLMGIAIDAAGNAFVANFGGGRVIKVTPAGTVTSVLECGGGWGPTGVTLARGDLYVLEWGGVLGVRVRKLSARGEVTTLAVVR